MTDVMAPDFEIPRPNPWFRNALVRHDGSILAANIRDLAVHWRDGAAVAFLAVVAILFVRSSLAGLQPSSELATMLVVSSGTAILCDLSLRSRAQYFRAESPLAPIALVRHTSLAYRMVAHSLTSIGVCLLLCAANWPLAVQFEISWWVSLIPVALLASLGSAGQRAGLFNKFGWLGLLWRSRRFGTGWKALTMVLAPIVIFLPSLFAENGAAIAAGILSLLALAWFSPVDYSVVNFQRIVGLAPFRSVRAILLRPAQIGLLLFMASVASMNGRSMAMVGSVVVIVLLYRFLTVMLSRIVSARQVQFAMVVVVGMTLSAAIALPYVAPLPVLFMVVWLNRYAARRTWIME